jgi:hypothetical protein
MSHHPDTWVEFEDALSDYFLSAAEDKRDLKTMLVPRYEGNIEDSMTQMT